MLLLLPAEVVLRILKFLDAEACTNAGRTCRDLRVLCIDDAFRRGKKLQRKRFLREALKFFSVVLHLDSVHKEALDERAIIWFNVSHRPNAIADLRRSMAVASSEAERLAYASMMHELQGELQESLRCSRRALKLDPKLGRAWFELGYVLQELPFDAEYGASVEAYRNAVACGYHRQYVSIFNRGFAHEAAGHLEEAIADYEETWRMNPYFSQAVRSLARLKVKQGGNGAIEDDCARLEQQLAEVVVTHPKKLSQSAHLLVQLAYFRDAVDDFDAAVTLYEKALAWGHPRPELLYNSLGWLHAQRGRAQKALDAWRQAVNIAPRYAMAREALAKHYLRQGDVLSATRELELMEPFAPAQSFMLRAMVSMDQRLLPEAIALLERALEYQVGAERTDVRLYLVEYLCEAERFDEALVVLETVLGWYPRAARPLKLHAHLCLYVGRLAQAEANFRKVLEHHPEDDVALMNLGCLLFCRGLYEESEVLFSKRLEQDGDDFKALCNRAHANLKLERNHEALIDYERLRQRFPGSVTESMLETIRDTPEVFASAVNADSLMFCREMRWEGYMNKIARRIVVSPEFVRIQVNQ